MVTRPGPSKAIVAIALLLGLALAGCAGAPKRVEAPPTPPIALPPSPWLTDACPQSVAACTMDVDPDGAILEGVAADPADGRRAVVWYREQSAGAIVDGAMAQAGLVTRFAVTEDSGASWTHSPAGVSGEAPSGQAYAWGEGGMLWGVFLVDEELTWDEDDGGLLGGGSFSSNSLARVIVARMAPGAAWEVVGRFAGAYGSAAVAMVGEHLVVAWPGTDSLHGAFTLDGKVWKETEASIECPRIWSPAGNANGAFLFCGSRWSDGTWNTWTLAHVGFRDGSLQLVGSGAGDCAFAGLALARDGAPLVARLCDAASIGVWREGDWTWHGNAAAPQDMVPEYVGAPVVDEAGAVHVQATFQRFVGQGIVYEFDQVAQHAVWSANGTLQAVTITDVERSTTPDSLAWPSQSRGSDRIWYLRGGGSTVFGYYTE